MVQYYTVHIMQYYKNGNHMLYIKVDQALYLNLASILSYMNLENWSGQYCLSTFKPALNY